MQKFACEEKKEESEVTEIGYVPIATVPIPDTDRGGPQ